MVVETVFTEGVAHLSYLIGDKATGKAAVIDPRRDVEVYIELARKNKLSITHVLETHIHADFVSGTRELVDRTGTAKAVLSVEGGAKYGFECDSLKDGDKIDLGRVILTARHTPATPRNTCRFWRQKATDQKPRSPCSAATPCSRIPWGGPTFWATIRPKGWRRNSSLRSASST